MAETTSSLHAFLTDNRDELIARVRAKVKERTAPLATEMELERGVPLFLTQLTALLTRTMTAGEEDAARGIMRVDAALRGQSLLEEGLTVGQVVHDYGDICQVVTQLAVERQVPIAAADFRAFNQCLDDAIAGAVTEYGRVKEQSIAAEGAERLGVLAHELRNVLSTAMLAFDTIKRSLPDAGGSVGAMHTRSLVRLRDLVDRSLTTVRLDAEMIRRERVVVAAFLEEEEIAATIRARMHNLELSVRPTDVNLIVEIDPQVLGGALANLLQNAFKFTRPRGRVTLSTRATDLRVLIDVEDQCGGLPEGKIDELFRPFEQHGADRSGLGLGLGIARRAVISNGGELRAEDLPPVGCRFTIDLPRCVVAPARVS